MKKCTRCKEYKSLESFSKNKSKKDGLNGLCRKCNTIYCREKLYKRVYGITKEIYNSMYKQQGGRCFICGDRYDILCVDHNHSTKEVRSLLCTYCNYNLGRYKENTKIFQNFIDYLNYYK